MSYPANVTNLHPQASPPKPQAMPEERIPYAFDAALSNEPAQRYVPSQSFETALASWLQVIADQKLSDVPIASLQSLTVDWRDGALCRGKGGTGYTPHAWSQLVSLMKAQGAPAGIANSLRWLGPLARHFGWADVVRRSLRPRTEEGILRMFLAPRPGVAGATVPAVRAVVSGRHSLTHFDDSAVAEVIRDLPEAPTRARIHRGWDVTHGTFTLTSGSPETRLGFYLRNSETGCASLSFSAALEIAALDAEVVMPDGAKFERIVRLASANAASRRRHTLPRYSTSSGTRISEMTRARIARERIAEDIETAMEGARVLAQRWVTARSEINAEAIKLAKLTKENTSALMVLEDFLRETPWAELCEVEGLLKGLVEVISDDARLRSIPHGSAAHMAAALALVAQKRTNWEEVVELQRLSGQFLMEGWTRR